MFTLDSAYAIKSCYLSKIGCLNITFTRLISVWNLLHNRCKTASVLLQKADMKFVVRVALLYVLRKADKHHGLNRHCFWVHQRRTQTWLSFTNSYMSCLWSCCRAIKVTRYEPEKYILIDSFFKSLNPFTAQHYSNVHMHADLLPFFQEWAVYMCFNIIYS